MAIPRALRSGSFRLVLALSDEVAGLVRESPAGWDSSLLLDDFAIAYELNDVLSLLDSEDFETVRAGRLLSQHTAAQIIELEARARKNGWPPETSLLSYWIVDFGPNEPRDLSAWDVASRFCHALYTMDLPSLKQIGVKPGRFHQKIRGRRSVPRDSPGKSVIDAGPATHMCADHVSSKTRYPEWPCELYLGPAPDGVNARSAWDGGFAGQGVRCVDVESAWAFTDPEIRLDPDASLIFNECNPDDFCRTHGTNSIGVVAGRQLPILGAPEPGILGIAPELHWVRTASMYRASNEWGVEEQWDITAAIVAGTLALEAGDVLLIEIQSCENATKLPIEVVQPVFDAIRVAVGNGIIVIEPAGNGSNNLKNDPSRTQFANPEGLELDRSEHHRPATCSQLRGRLREGTPPAYGHPAAAYHDSGAIMVGACKPRLNVWNDRTNYGSRLDCFAWGMHIRGVGHPLRDCTDAEHPGSINWTDNHYGLTSGASAIIAGVAVLTQQMAKAGIGRPLTPFEMREVLSCPELGTAGKSVEHIGVMPDLEKIGRLLSVK